MKRKFSVPERSLMRRKAKFRTGQVVQVTITLEWSRKNKDFGKLWYDTEGRVWIEKELRPLTKRERGERHGK